MEDTTEINKIAIDPVSEAPKPQRFRGLPFQEVGASTGKNENRRFRRQLQREGAKLTKKLLDNERKQRDKAVAKLADTPMSELLEKMWIEAEDTNDPEMKMFVRILEKQVNGFEVGDKVVIMAEGDYNGMEGEVESKIGGDGEPHYSVSTIRGSIGFPQSQLAPFMSPLDLTQGYFFEDAKPEYCPDTARFDEESPSAHKVEA